MSIVIKKKLASYFIITKLLCVFMFFKKKETKDVDILQQIKEKIDADNV